jgi:hypothetical protein
MIILCKFVQRMATQEKQNKSDAMTPACNPNYLVG